MPLVIRRGEAEKLVGIVYVDVYSAQSHKTSAQRHKRDDKQYAQENTAFVRARPFGESRTRRVFDMAVESLPVRRFRPFEL